VGRPKEHGAQTRAALLAAAAELLHEEGPGAVSVRRVAAAVGTSTRAVYSLFHDKEGLLRELSVDVAETMRRHHESVPVSDDPATEILELTLAYRAAALEKPKLYDLFFGTVSPGASPADPLFALVYRSFERVLRVVRRGIADGMFPGRTEFDIGRNLFALVHGLASLELRGVLGDGTTAPGVWRQSVTATLIGLREPPAGAAEALE
jgi:AcrR family transcriptional regulator